MNILYLHGFSSASGSKKTRQFAREFETEQFHCPTYPAHQPRRAVQFLCEYIKRHSLFRSTRSAHKAKPSLLVFIGSSLGAYYAQYLATVFSGSKTILINPALTPQSILKNQLGFQRNMVNQQWFEFTHDDWTALQDYDVAIDALIHAALVLCDADDNVINHLENRRRYANIATYIEFPGGSHAFDHMNEAIPLIRKWLNNK